MCADTELGILRDERNAPHLQLVAEEVCALGDKTRFELGLELCRWSDGDSPDRRSGHGSYDEEPEIVATGEGHGHLIARQCRWRCITEEVDAVRDGRIPPECLGVERAVLVAIVRVEVSVLDHGHPSTCVEDLSQNGLKYVGVRPAVPVKQKLEGAGVRKIYQVGRLWR